MVCLLRVDGRLIHGMVAVTWVGAEKPDVLAVANTEAANDSFHTMTLKLAKPAGVDCYVWTLDKAVDRVNGEKYAHKRILMTVATVEDAYHMVKNCPSITRLNIGPEVDGTKGRTTEGKVQVSDGVYINEAKYQLLKELHEGGVDVFAQITPAMPRVSWEEIAKHFEK